MHTASASDPRRRHHDDVAPRVPCPSPMRARPSVRGLYPSAPRHARLPLVCGTGFRPAALVASAALALFAAPAAAQWSSDPAVNLLVAGGSGEQILPKIAPTADGGCWISWFDGGSGYDVRVQRLDLGGNPLLGANGILVADRSFSSVQDYGLDLDVAGNAILTFRDDRFGGTQITAAAVAPDGTLLWGANGVQLTNTTAFVASPKIAGTADGGAVVAWTQDTSTRLRKLDAAGSLQWVGDVVLTPGGGSYSASDLHDAGNDVIVSFIHQLGGFGTPRHILAQKLDADGTLLWGAGHVAVFDGGSVQFGNFPPFVPDGAGGAVFAWYDAGSSQLQCSVQRILADGSEAFAHDGVDVSTVASRVRVSPSAAIDVATEEIYVFWREQTSNQAQSGVYGQKLDVNGARQWSDAGAQVVPISTDEIGTVETWATDGGALAFWDRTPSFGQDRIYGARLDTNGTVEVPTFDVASVPAGKSRLQVRESAAGFAILAWQDEKLGSVDVFAQSVGPDGALGLDPATLPGDSVFGDPRSGRWAQARPNPSHGAVTLVVRAVNGAEGAIDAAAGPESGSGFGPEFGSADGATATPGPAATYAQAAGTVIIDAHGRLVRRGLDLTALGLRWDGRSDDGRTLPDGVYWAKVPGTSAAAPITLVR